MGKLLYKELLKEVFYIKEETQEKYKIIIGTDSAHGTTDFVSNCSLSGRTWRKAGDDSIRKR